MKCQHSHHRVLPHLLSRIAPLQEELPQRSKGRRAWLLCGLLFGSFLFSCEAQLSEGIELPVLRWAEDATELIRANKEDCNSMGVALLGAWFKARPLVLESLEQLRAEPELRAALLIRHEERISRTLLRALPAYQYCANDARFREQLRVGLELEALRKRDLNETQAGD